MTRRDCLLLLASSPLLAAETDMPRRIGRLISEYEGQGIHRTGTETDKASADWLMGIGLQAGLKPVRESFSLNRVDVIESHVTRGGRRIEGIPLFDGAFTDAAGITGKIGPLGSDAPIGLMSLPPNAAGAGAIGEARRQNKHRAIVAITRGGKPGLCPSNADSFLHPFGPPVVQIAEPLNEAGEVTVTAHVQRTPATAYNVVATIPGTDRAQPPLIVMTPRSGWWTCASERGGGIACWVESMRALRDSKPNRDVVFVASSGHEVGYLGIEAFVAARPGIVKSAHAWIHFGANIGAAQDPGNTIQASDADMESREAEAMAKENLKIDRRVPRGTVPGGEAGVVHRGGGRYMSIIGRNALFHNPEDRGPGAIDANQIARFAEAFTVVAAGLSS